MSSTPYFKIAIRSTPMPNANPLTFPASESKKPETLGSTMPQPSSSIQPLALQLGQRPPSRYPLPPQKIQLICTSALGSVKGKKDGENRVFTLDPNSAFMA